MVCFTGFSVLTLHRQVRHVRKQRTLVDSTVTSILRLGDSPRGSCSNTDCKLPGNYKYINIVIVIMVNICP